MAADGYGAGKVSGFNGEESVTIHTADTQKSFLFDKEPSPEELAEKAHKHFSDISKERDMKH